MSLTKQLAHNTAAQLVGKVISTLLGLFAIGMLTRYLGTERFGWYVTTLAFLQFIAILIDFGLIPVTSQMMSEVPKGITEEDTPALESHRARLLKNLLAFRFTTAIIGLGIAPFIALFFPYPHEVKIAIAFTTINMLSVAMNQIFIGYYQSKLSTYFQALGEICGRIALILGLILCIHFNLGFIPVMWAITLSSVVYTGAMWLFTKKNIVGFAFDSEVWKAIAIKMWPISLSIMFNVIYLKGDTVILSFFRDQMEVGLYGAAYRVIDIISQTAMLIMGLMLPLLAYAWSTGNEKTFKEHLQLAFNVMMMFAIPMSVGLIVLSERIMTIVAGPEFRNAGTPLVLLSIAVFGVFIGAIFGHLAVAINRQKETIPVYLTNAIITIILYFIFIPRYGMIGAAGASVFSELFAALFLYLVIKKYSHISLSWTVVGKALFAGVLMAGSLFFLQGLPLIIPVIVGGIVYGGVLLLTNAVSFSTLREVMSLKKNQ